MSKKEVPLLTINSLTALSKVCSSTNFSNSFKAHPLSQHLSTAAQKYDLSSSVGCHLDHSNDPFQNPDGSYPQTQYSNGFSQNPNRNDLNPNWGFRETAGNASGNNRVSHFGNSKDSHLQNNGDYRNYSNSADRNGSFREYDVNTNAQFQYERKEVSTWNSVSFQDRPKGIYEGNGNYRGHSELQGSWNNKYTQKVHQFQPGPSGYYAGNVGGYQHIPNDGQYQRNVNVGGYQPKLNGVQDVMEACKVSCSPKVEGNLDESSEGVTYKGTLVEFDDFCKEKKVKETVVILSMLEEQQIPVDLPRILQLMEACGELKSLEEAKVVHDYVVRSQYPLGVSMSNKILEMYGKCGNMDNAFAVFKKMPERNLASWNIMITWLAKNRFGEDAIDLFSEFKQAGLVPDAQLFIGVFSACRVVGDVNEGMLHFESMRKDYGIVPSMDHFVSIVEMMGTSGYLDEALEFVEKMPMEPSIDIWETLMNLSRVHGNLELGDRCAELVELIDPSRLNKQSKAGLVPVKESDLTGEREKKIGNQNLLEVRSRVHEYRAGDTSHPETDRIYAMLRGLRAQMREFGYIPETRFVLHDVDQECKEDALLSHSERLAAAYGLLTSPARSPIRVIKNLRVCGDCHNALKIISKIVGRELIMRDAKRFHHFKDGVCSCRDYW